MSVAFSPHCVVYPKWCGFFFIPRVYFSRVIVLNVKWFWLFGRLCHTAASLYYRYESPAGNTKLTHNRVPLLILTRTHFLHENQKILFGKVSELPINLNVRVKRYNRFVYDNVSLFTVLLCKAVYRCACARW